MKFVVLFFVSFCAWSGWAKDPDASKGAPKDPAAKESPTSCQNLLKADASSSDGSNSNFSSSSSARASSDAASDADDRHTDHKHAAHKSQTDNNKDFEFWFENATPDQKAKLVADFKDSIRIAELLGYRVPSQQFVFMSSEEILKFIAAGGPAAPHWMDGYQILHSRRYMGVMEFVEPGHLSQCAFCRSFYDEATPRHEQQSIADHVMGHNHVSQSSRIGAAEYLDRIQAAVERVKTIQHAYQEHDIDEVSLYVQLLHSAGDLVDLVGGTLDKVEDLKPQSPKGPEFFEGLRDAFNRPIEKKQIYDNHKHPRNSTPSVIQALTANPSPTSYSWQTDLMNAEEKKSRFTPGFMQRRILDEGWATFSQALIARHREYDKTGKTIDVAQLITAVRGPGYLENKFNHKKSWYGPTLGEKYLKNVYWLGYEGWRNLWRRFYERPEVQAMKTILEKDQAFVKYATRIIESFTDAQFLRLALDDKWILRHRLNLSRPISGMEASDYPELEQYQSWFGMPMYPGEPNVVLSTSPERIRQQIVRRYANKALEHPRILLTDFNHRGEEVLYEQQIVDLWPVALRSAAQMLYLLTRIHEKPVTLKTGIAPLSLMPPLKAWHFSERVLRGIHDGIPPELIDPIGGQLKKTDPVPKERLGPGDIYQVSPQVLKSALQDPLVQEQIAQMKKENKNYTTGEMLVLNHKLRQVIVASYQRSQSRHKGSLQSASSSTTNSGSSQTNSDGFEEWFGHPPFKFKEEAGEIFPDGVEIVRVLLERPEVFELFVRVRPSGKVEVDLVEPKSFNQDDTWWVRGRVRKTFQDPDLVDALGMKDKDQAQTSSKQRRQRIIKRRQYVERLIFDFLKHYVRYRVQPRLQKAVDLYKADLILNLNKHKIKLEKSKYAPALKALMHIWLNDKSSALSQSPLAGEAVLIFMDLIKRRVQKALQEAVAGAVAGGTPAGSSRATSSGLAVKAVPIVPSFKLDPRVKKLRRKISRPNEYGGFHGSIYWHDLAQALLYDEQIAWPGGWLAFVDEDLPTLPIGQIDDYVDIGQGDWLPGELFFREFPQSDEIGDAADDECDGEGDSGEYDDETDVEDGPGDPGGEGAGAGDPLQPGEVLVPYKVWGQVLKQYFRLPNPRPTTAGDAKDQLVYAGQYHRDDEPLLPDPTSNEAFEEGIARWFLENPGKDINKLSPEDETSLFEMGFSHLDPNLYVTRAYQPKPVPEFKAVLVIDEDMSGSMQWGIAKQTAKNFAYNMLAFLRANYKHVEVVFVGHSDYAKEFEEKEFWKASIDGGTLDSTGFELSHKIMTTRYPKSQYNRYFLSLGDAGNSYDDDARAVQWLEKINPEVQHGVYVTVWQKGVWWGSQPTGNEAYNQFAANHKWFDTVVVDGSLPSMLQAFQKLYGKRKGAGH